MKDSGLAQEEEEIAVAYISTDHVFRVTHPTHHFLL